MKQFLLLQPIVLFVTVVGLLWVSVSMTVGLIALITGILVTVTIVYLLRNRRNSSLKQNLKHHEVEAFDIVPISSGAFNFDVLTFEKDKLSRYSTKDLVWQIKYNDIYSVHSDVNGMRYTLKSKDSSEIKFSIYPLKSRKEVFSSVTNPQLAVGIMSTAGFESFGTVSAMSMSMASSGQRIAAMNIKLEAVLPKDTIIETVNTVAFKTSDIVVGILLALEIFALIAVAYFSGLIR